ncbi:MAG: TRAP transporter large permease subunit [Clostridia bacterium]|nr:TRAP transporter large permease subunit [Clostridia bacterium]
MPFSVALIAGMLTFILFIFLVLKRPVYEAVFLSFIALVAVTGTWDKIGIYINEALSTPLIYSMVSFMAMSVLLTKTKVVDKCISIILSVMGKIPGGAGYTAVIASTFMGAFSGSGPGNVMATGAITIPAMKKSGFPPELAGNIESNSSYLGNMVPPSSNIVAALGALAAAYPAENMSVGRFWIILWGISFWFILQRIVMVWGFCKYYKIKPLTGEELPSFKETLKEGWQGLLLPVIILLPFILDYIFKDGFFTERLGKQGAKYLSNSLLLFVGGVAAFYGCVICKNKQMVTISSIAKYFSDSMKTIAPTIGVCVFGYMIGAVFAELDIANDFGRIIAAWQFGKIGTVAAVCAITCFMGMVVPGSSIVVIFGSVFITVLAKVGCNPVVAAAMLPCICGVMCGITPPLGLGMYAGMTLSGADFTKTLKNNLWWVGAQFIMEVVVLMECLPIFGL